MTLEEIDLIIEGKINIIDKYRLELNNLKQKRKEIIDLMNTDIKPSRLNLTELKKFIDDFVGFDIPTRKKQCITLGQEWFIVKLQKTTAIIHLEKLARL